MRSLLRLIEGLMMLALTVICLYFNVTSAALLCILVSIAYFYLSLIEE